MGLGALFLLLGLGAVLALADGFSDDPTETETPADETAAEQADDRDGDDILRDPDADLGATLVGTDDADTLEHDPEFQTYLGRDGDDTLIGGDTAARYLGEGGDDLLVAFDSDRAEGGAGDDTVIGLHDRLTTGPQVLEGNDGNDTIATRGWSVLRGGDGEDTFVLAPDDLSDDGDWLFDEDAQRYPVPLIQDFDPAEDRIVIDLGTAWAQQVPGGVQGSHLSGPSQLDPDGVLGQVAERGGAGGMFLTWDGVPMAYLQGAGPIDLSQVVVVR